MQGRNGDANVENRLVDTVGEGERGMERVVQMEKVASTYIYYHV